MNQLLMKIREQVDFLLSDYRFIAHQGAYLEGELVGIEIVSRKWNGSSLCDLHFRVIPAYISEDVPAEVLTGAHKAAVEAQFDHNPNVRFAAQHLLLSLKEERISRGDLEGIEVRLDFKDEGDPEASVAKKTDRNGEIWFRDISDTALCSMSIEQIPPPPPPDPFPPPPYVETQQMNIHAESSTEPPLQIQPGSTHQIVYLADRRIVALLEEIVGGKAVLTLETHAEEFNGATVRFEWGCESGEIKLQPAATQDRWSGQRRLNESFKSLVSAVPNFEVMPRR
jgi:hypothetical protein